MSCFVNQDHFVGFCCFISPSETHTILFFDRCTAEAPRQELMSSATAHQCKLNNTNISKSMKHTNSADHGDSHWFYVLTWCSDV